jgi:hypothetical protein
MNGTAACVICCALSTCIVNRAVAQPAVSDTRAPQVTAENESWYLAGTPITYEGHFYYPAGPRVHFIPSEMVRSGDFRGVPLYARTTIEPYSIVFVPVGGGLLQPYERRRDGELAGTVGSSVPSFPVAPSSDLSLGRNPFGPQAPAPPRLTEFGSDAQALTGEQPVGTSGAAPNIDRADATRAARLAGALRPMPRRADSANAIFVEYDNARWFSSGPPVAYDPSEFVRSGEKDGFPIYRKRGASRRTIYVPIVKDAGGVLAPYSMRDR